MLWFLYSSVGIMAFATAAAAQDMPNSADQNPAASSSTEAQVGISDIVVTASRRAENVQNAALSIQALSNETLTRANVSKPEDLARLAPGVQIATSGTYAQVYIRGVGNYGTQAYAEGAVAFNLDGVYISRPWGTRGIFYDLERVEVLKGPQGTLYGRNASGGAINIITAKPKLGSVSGFAEVQAGNYDLRQGTAAINLPLGDTVAVRASGQIIDRDGYLSDGYLDEKGESARLQLLWKPSEDFSLLLHGSYQHLGGRGGGGILTPGLPGEKFRGGMDPEVIRIIRAQPGTGALLAVPKADGFLNANIYSIGAEMNWDLGFATLTILPAYRDSKLRDRNYVPGFQVDDAEHDKQTSLEARIGNSSDKLKWVLGGYYFDEDQGNLPGSPLQAVRQGISGQTSAFKLLTRSYAAFGQATYSLTDALRFTGGLRYTYERKALNGLLLNYAFPSPPGSTTCAPGTVFDPGTVQPPAFCRRNIPLGGRLTYNNLTYKVGVEFDVAPRSMAYATLSTGFKSGGFFNAPAPNTFRPEKLTSLEAGIKNRFLDNRLQVNVEAFYWRYKDHQESHIGPTSIPGYFTFLTENAGRAESYGLDLDVVLQATQYDELNIKVQYNKSKYNSFSYSHPTASFGTPVLSCGLGAVVNGSQIIDCSGKQLVRTPTWSGTAGYSHTFDLGDAGRLTANANTRFSSSYFLSIEFLPIAKQDSYAVGDFDLTYTSANSRWSVSGFIQNIWNEVVLERASRYPFVNAANPLANRLGLYLSNPRPPRTYGVRARYNF